VWFIVTPIPSLFFPPFVVIKITPLVPFDPYNAAAEAPFNTEIDSISLGLMSEAAFP